MSVRLSYIWLSQRFGVGAVTINELLEAFKSPEAIYKAGREELAKACSLNNKQLKSLCDKSLDYAESIINECMRKDIRIITIGDTEYPKLLSRIPDPPVALYVRGRWPDFDSTPGIAVVGTRKATFYGQNAAHSIGEALAKAGFITVSGMALGIDGMAHRGALEAGGITVAVLAGGADVCYPYEHRGLMGDIMLSGAVLSEYPPGTPPAAGNYHQRNRIISGLCVASVIVEAKNYRSGSCITARHAVDQGRDVYAVPGSWGAVNSAGCNKLIEESQATLLSSPSALVRNYRHLLPARPGPYSSYPNKYNDRDRNVKRAPEKAANSPPPQARPGDKAKQGKAAAGKIAGNFSDEERAIIGLVREGVADADDIIDRCGIPANKVMGIITMLEVNGVFSREQGKLILRNL